MTVSWKPKHGFFLFFFFYQLKFGSNPNGLFLVRRGLGFVCLLVPMSENSIVT